MAVTQSARKEEFEKACSSATSLIAFLRKKAENHNNYKIYTNEDRLSSWMNSQTLYLSNGSSWNDKEDRGRFNSDLCAYMKFGICFSFSKSENVAMWMLYGGMKKEGVMIDLQRSDIKQLLETRKINLGWWENGVFKQAATLGEEEFSIEISDVVYYSDSLDAIKRSDTRCDCTNGRLIKALGWRRKVYPWCYENECRLVVTVDKQRIENSQIDTVQISVDDMLEKLEKLQRIYRAPNSMSTQHQVSRLSTQIDWDLCKSGCLLNTQLPKEQ